MSKDQIADARLERRLRDTFDAVAQTVTLHPQMEPSPVRGSPWKRRLSRWLLGLGAVVVAIPVAAGAWIAFGPEYVDQVPPEGVIVAGALDGERYWLVEPFHEDFCGRRMPGVEFLTAEDNIVGREWASFGITYGRLVQKPLGTCGVDTSSWLADPSRISYNAMSVGGGWVSVFAVHPDVTALRVTMDGHTRDVAVHHRDGAGYGLVETPDEIDRWTVALVADGTVVPDSGQIITAPPCASANAAC